MRYIPILCLALAVALSGCKRQEPPAVAGKVPEKKLLIGLIPEQNIFAQLERYEPLAAYVSDRIGRRIELKILSQYFDVIDAFSSKGLDGAFFGSFTYALAHERLGVEVVARPEDVDGVSTYYGVILVRGDSGIETASDMKGKKFAFVDKATTAGYLFPLHYFREHGITDYEAFFRETYFAGTHEDAVYDVLNGKADVGVAKSSVYERLLRADPRFLKELSIIGRSPSEPENALAVRRGMEPKVKARMGEVLLGMHEDPAGREVLRRFGAGRFVSTSHEDYASVYRYARDIGLDLSTYTYTNEP